VITTWRESSTARTRELLQARGRAVTPKSRPERGSSAHAGVRARDGGERHSSRPRTEAFLLHDNARGEEQERRGVCSGSGILASEMNGRLRLVCVVARLLEWHRVALRFWYSHVVPVIDSCRSVASATPTVTRPFSDSSICSWRLGLTDLCRSWRYRRKVLCTQPHDSGGSADRQLCPDCVLAQQCLLCRTRSLAQQQIPSPTTIWARAGHQGKLNKAIQQFERVLQLRTDNAPAHNSLGVALATQGKWNEATPHWERALQLEPDNAQATTTWATRWPRAGNWIEAVRHLERALQLNRITPAPTII